MKRLLGWHMGLGETGLRLFLLHLYWIGYTLRGGVVLGAFPATAAVYAVLRKDLLHPGADDGERGSLRQEFGRAWTREFRAANGLGYTFAALWALLVVDFHLLNAFELGGAAPIVAGLLWLLMAFLFCMTASIGALSAHFSQGVLALVRRSAVLVLARPLLALVNALIVAAVLCVYYVVPGLVPVFGLVVPVFFSFGYIWSTRVLARGSVEVEPGSGVLSGRVPARQ